MLKKSSRLTTKQFNEVMQNGKVFHTPFFTARFHSIDTRPVGMAAVAPVKIAKTAVLRNRVRRRIYSAVKPFIENISGCRIILIAKPPLLKDESMDVIRGDLRGLFVKAGVLR
jgi:ribonuclease P protein component